MKKYRFIQLCIEMTRKCNLKCEHCMRGNAQDVTLTYEIIDKLLSQVTEIEDISLMGGEPLLALDALEYLIYTIEQHKTKVLYIDFVTNGTIMDERIIQLLTRFTEKNTERKARISISNDDFHYAEKSHECYEFYKPMSNDRIEVKYNGESASEAYKNKSYHLLYFSGKATSLVMKGLDFNGLPIIAGVPENSLRSHQIKIVDNTIHCGLYLAANGNLGFRSQNSYGDFDNLAFGNILHDSLHDILTRHNATCPYLCDETYNEMLCYNAAFMKNYGGREKDSVEDEKTKFVAKIRMKKLDLFWQLRKWALNKYPEIGIEKIIKSTVVDDDFFFQKVANLMIKRMPDEKLRFNPRIKRLAQIMPDQVLSYKIHHQYKKHYQIRFPNASEDEHETLSAMNSMFKFIMSMTLDDLIEAVFDGNGAEGYFEKLDFYMQQNGIDNEELNACGLIPDTFTPRDDEQESSEEN